MKLQIIATLILVVFGLQISAEDPEKFFPMEQGNYWIYRGKTGWTIPGTNQVLEKTITWKMEVLDEIKTPHVHAALLSGHPYDLAWYEEGKQRGEYLLVRQNSKFFLIEDDARDLAQRLKNNISIATKFDDSNLILDFPLKEGKKFAGDVARQDNFYCWLVETSQSIRISDVAGLPPIVADQYLITMRTLPDHQFVLYTAGIGISRYTYGHHGTVSYTDVQLIECHLQSSLSHE